MNTSISHNGVRVQRVGDKKRARISFDVIDQESGKRRPVTLEVDHKTLHYMLIIINHYDMLAGPLGL